MMVLILKNLRILIILTLLPNFVSSQISEIRSENLQKFEGKFLRKNQFYFLKSYNSDNQTLSPDFIVVRRLSVNNGIIVKLKDEVPVSAIPNDRIFLLTDFSWKFSKNTFEKSNSSKKYYVRTIQDFYNSEGVTILNNYQNTYLIECSPEKIRELSANPNVVYISRFQKPIIETPVSGHDLTVNSITYAQSVFGIFGEEMNVSVKEELFDTTDVDLKNRYFLTGNQTERISQHATAIATLISGGENSSWQGRGIAPKSRVTSSSFLNLLPQENPYYQDNEIFVENHSYGIAIEHEYGIEAATIDEHVNSIPQVLHVYSSGNSGLITPEDGRYSGIEGYANLTGNMKMAKNILTVGAVDDTGAIIDRSSKGPAYDGRVKPELVAYATTGTSDAAAIISGASLLIQQKYKAEHGEIPSSALVKALLVAGADDVGRPNVDFESGFGNVNVYRSLNILDSENFYNDVISTDSEKRFEITVPENAAELRIVLSWNDPAANPGDDVSLVNDLDLQASLNGTRYLPWVLDSRPEAIEQPAVRKRDSLNNIEMITVKDPQSGNMNISVLAEMLHTEEQEFSIAYEIRLKNEFNWTFPDAENPFKLNTSNKLRWLETFDVNQGKLEMSMNGEEWQLIADNVNLQSGFYDASNFEAGKARLRMSIEGSVYISEEFVIAEPMSARVIYNCEDEIGFSWPETPGATSYILQNLGEKYLEDLEETMNTSLEISKSQTQSDLFAVVPVFGSQRGAIGQSINYQLQGVSCYYQNFFVFLDDPNSVVATLNLSTLFNVQQIEFFKKVNGELVSTAVFAVPFNTTSFRIDDMDLQSGDNFYFAVITLQNGTEIYTNEEPVFIPGEDYFELAPNPVQNGENLEIISKGDNLDFQVFDMRGQLVFQEKLIQFNDRLQINGLSRGVYIIRAMRNNDVVGVEKAIIL